MLVDALGIHPRCYAPEESFQRAKFSWAGKAAAVLKGAVTMRTVCMSMRVTNHRRRELLLKGWRGSSKRNGVRLRQRKDTEAISKC